MQFSENEFFYISSLNFDAIELKFGHNVQKNKAKKNLGADFWFFGSFSFFRQYFITGGNEGPNGKNLASLMQTFVQRSDLNLAREIAPNGKELLGQSY